jgi:hypothetical protein
MSDNFSFKHVFREYYYGSPPKLYRKPKLVKKMTGVTEEIKRSTEKTDYQCMEDTYDTILKFFADKPLAMDVMDMVYDSYSSYAFIIFFEDEYDIVPGKDYDEHSHKGIAVEIPTWDGEHLLEISLVRWLDKTLDAVRRYYAFCRPGSGF